MTLFHFEKSKNFVYNISMKRFLLFIIFAFGINSVFAADEGLSKQATAFYSDNNNKKALELILQINEEKRTAQDWLILGNILADSGEPENAVFMYQRAINTDKKCYKAYYNLGIYYSEKGMKDSAITNFKKAAAIKNDNPYILYNLASAYMNIDDYKHARTYLNKAITLKSDVPEFHYNLAYVYQKLGNEKMAKTYWDNYKKLVNQV